MTRKKKPGQKYKLKTHKATAKRFKLTGSGKLVRTKGPMSHLRRNKSKRTKNLFGTMEEVKSKGDQKRIRQLAPYIKKYNSRPSRPGSRTGGKR